MYRNHFNTLKLRDIRTPGKLPFYNWQCITLKTESRDIYLVIPNENDMNLFLKYLIRSLYTIDGSKGSALKII